EIVLIGEIRALGGIAERATQTRHLVFSTLHANDRVTAITRLVQTKGDPFLVPRSMSALVCQAGDLVCARMGTGMKSTPAKTSAKATVISSEGSASVASMPSAIRNVHSPSARRTNCSMRGRR